MKYFNDNPSCVLIQHDARVTDGDSNVIIKSFQSIAKSEMVFSET